MKFVISFALLLVVFTNCTHQPNKIVVPITPDSTSISCDSIHVSYTTYIKPIFSSNCYNCHCTDSIIARGGGLDLEDTVSLKQYLSYDFRGDGKYGSKLLHCVLHSQFALPMPPTYIMDNCTIVKLRNWISLGANMH